MTEVTADEVLANPALPELARRVERIERLLNDTLNTTSGPTRSMPDVGRGYLDDLRALRERVASQERDQR